MAGIAVVIPCLDQGRLLGDALESVRGQRRAADEILVVDYGSIDLFTRSFLASLHHPEVRIVRTVNNGLAAARNYGVRSTSEKYVVIVEPHHLLHSEYLARTAGRLDANPGLGFVCAAVRSAAASDRVWIPPDCTIVNALVRDSPPATSLFRHAVWEAVGGFDESLTCAGCGIVDFWLSALERGFGGQVIAEPLVEWRGRASARPDRRPRDMEVVLRKHRATIDLCGAGLLVEKGRCLDEERTRLQERVRERSALRAELAAVEAEIARVRQGLAEQGVPSLDWGEIGVREGWGSAVEADRGLPIAHYYVGQFIGQHLADQHGDVLEIRNSESCRDAVDRAQRMAAMAPTRRTATLAEISNLPAGSFDCVVMGDALRAAYDVRAALADLHRILRPGGVLLCALPAADRMSGTCNDGADYWRFTEAATRHLFAEVFPPEAFTVIVFGNVMVSAAALAGVAADDLESAERDFVDPMFPLGYCVRAVKPEDPVRKAGESR